MVLHARLGRHVFPTSTQTKISGLYLKLAYRNDNRIFPKIFNTEEWEKLDWVAVDRSIDSMNKRVQRVLKEHRGHTKF
jgi:hypothetical protein